jgi:hypothetical protein
VNAPLSHSRAQARGECRDRAGEELDLLLLELALACLEGAALGRAVMLLRSAADESEALAADALLAASREGAGVAASSAALKAAGALARAERAELAAATRWADHVTQSRALARMALEVAAGARGGARKRARGRIDHSA